VKAMCPGRAAEHNGAEWVGGPCGEEGSWQPVITVSTEKGERLEFPLTDRYCRHCMEDGAEPEWDPDDEDDPDFDPDDYGPGPVDHHEIFLRSPRVWKQIEWSFADKGLPPPSQARCSLRFERP
jgi:hypothetical protein